MEPKETLLSSLVIQTTFQNSFAAENEVPITRCELLSELLENMYRSLMAKSYKRQTWGPADGLYIHCTLLQISGQLPHV